MKKVIRLTESELTNVIKRVVIETEMKEQTVNPEVMQTGEAILTIIGTVIGLLGFAGYDVLRDMAKKLMKQGKKEEANQIMSFIDEHQKGEEDMDSDPSGMGAVMKKRYEMDMAQIKDEEKNGSSMMESRIVRRKKK